ncbi:PEP-CTERM sorting domain-containing protein [Luteolibacter luteus]|uniref:PEP-CTERM sorting domain-containing protein n=1 Tax=Luteolibacter luteus TaxID=2728835 RepID=A0A858RCG8_9BACT|nr:PEP-CTERM sorting domain-containing protein [Luteolibacter luteus]QJE94726.1 PEP-CTERM sorting domain-containing protein [Luteolibacter luteus]
MNLYALLACAILALVLPGFSQSLSWDTDGTPGTEAFGNTLVFADGALGMSITSWGHTHGRKNDSFESGKSIIYPTGVGVTNRDEGMRVPEHQIDNGRGNDWVLIVFDSAVTDVKIEVDPYGVWDRDVTYYTANLSRDVDLSGLTYSDLADLGFGERTDDLGTRSSEAREIEIQGATTSFNAVLIGAQLGKQGFRGVDRFKIDGVSATPAVPEPSVTFLGLIGMIGLLRRRR